MEDEDLSREAIEDFHSKGTSVWVGELVNKGSFLTQVKLVTFFDGSEMPFEIDGSLNIKTRMPFAKARKLLPKPMFDPAYPMISCVEPLRYKNLAYLYTEVRPFNDVGNNGMKTAEFLLAQEWVAVIQTSKETKMYIFPTCSLSHELGITHRNHPQMLHGLFVKFLVNKDTRTSQGIPVDHLYKAGLAKPDRAISRDKVSVYQPASAEHTNNGKQIAHGLHNVAGATKIEPTVDATSSDKTTEAVVNIVTTDSFVSANNLEAKPATNNDGSTSKEQPSNELVGQKRKLSDSSGASPAKRTRASIHSSLQQLLVGKSDSTSQSYPADAATDINTDNITIAEEVFPPAEQYVITTTKLRSIINPIMKEIYGSGSPLKSQSSDTNQKPSDAAVTETAIPADESSSGTGQPSGESEFNVPQVVYDAPCKRPKSILKGGSRSEPDNEVATPPPLDDSSPTTALSGKESKIPRKIGLAEYKKRHKDRKDSEDPVDDTLTPIYTTSVANTTTTTAMETEDIALTIDLPTKATTAAAADNGKGSESEDVASSSDGTVTSKANVSVSFKEESKPESSSPLSKSDLQVVSYSKSPSVMKSPIKIPPHPMSVLTGPTTSGPFLSQMSAQFYGGSQFGGPAYPSEWPTYPSVFNGLLPTPPRPYLLHPANAPLPPSSILMGPPVYDPLPTATISTVESEMAQVEDLRERFTKTLQNELKRVIPSTESSRDSSPQPRRCRSLSRSPSPSLRKSRRGRSPHRFRKSSSRSQSLDSCRGSDREQMRSRSKSPRSRSKSPRSHRPYRSRYRHTSSSRESTESRRHFRSNKRSSRVEKRRDRHSQKHDTHSSTNVKNMGTQTIIETNFEPTKLVYEKEVQTDMLLFVHSKGSQTNPIPENSREAQTDNSMCSAFFNNFAQYLETYPHDVFHFNDILSSTIKYMDQEITRLFHPDDPKQEPLTLYPKQLRRVLECDYMRKLKRTKLPAIIAKERQAMYSASTSVDRPGTPLMDDNQPVVCLPTTVPADEAYDSSGLSNSDILSDSEGSDDNVPNINQLLSQYNNGITAEGSAQSTTEVDNNLHNCPTGNDTINNSEKYTREFSSVSSTEALNNEEEIGMSIKKENGKTDMSFVPTSSKLYQSPSGSPAKALTGNHNDHSYTTSISAKGQPHTAEHDIKCPEDSTHLTVLKPGERKKTSATESDSDTNKRPTPNQIPLHNNYWSTGDSKNSPYKSGGSPSSDDTPSIDDMEVAMYNEGNHLVDSKNDKEKGNTLELLTTLEYGTHSGDSPKELMQQTIVESDHDIIDMDISSNSSVPSSSMENTPDRDTNTEVSDTSKLSTSEKDKEKKSTSGKSNSSYNTNKSGKHSPLYSGRSHYQAGPCNYRSPMRHPQPQMMYPYSQPPLYQWHNWNNRRGSYWGPSRY